MIVTPFIFGEVQHTFNMPCFVCYKNGTLPVYSIKYDRDNHGITVTICSEECQTLLSIRALALTKNELIELVLTHRHETMGA